MLSGRDSKHTDKVKPCVMCGKLIEYKTEKKKYCEECRREVDRRSKRHSSEYKKIKKRLAKDAAKIAHQQDRTVWTRDYADRQKASTLAMLGPIEL